MKFAPFLCVAGTQSAAVKDDEGHDLLPQTISERTTLILSATVFTQTVGGGNPCENDGDTISNESLVIDPGQVVGASVAGRRNVPRLISDRS